MRQLRIMALLIGLTALGCARPMNAVDVLADNASEPIPVKASGVVVEYVRVKGEPCLQPKVIAGDPEEADLVRAQRQWLGATHPGYRLVRQSHVLTLAPEFRPAGHEHDEGPGENDSIEFVSADGKPISECFILRVPQSGAADR